jgi:hypothetical protein
VEGLFVSMIAGVFGVAYFVYGKKQAKLTPMLSGVALCIYPYLIDSVVWMIVIGVVLLAAPFVIDY